MTIIILSSDNKYIQIRTIEKHYRDLKTKKNGARVIQFGSFYSIEKKKVKTFSTPEFKYFIKQKLNLTLSSFTYPS